MLTITIPACDDLWDERAEKFLHTKETTLTLEHSLLSLTKWEQYYKRPFLANGPTTNEEIAYYISCMTINKSIDPLVYKAITVDIYQKILDYIGDPMTASTIKERPDQRKNNREQLTSELIYFYMFSYGIPKDCEKWHLNNLLMLIKIFGIKNDPDSKHNKMSSKDIYAQNKAARAAYRAKHGRR